MALRLLEILKLPRGPRACFRRPPSLECHRMMLGLRQVAPQIETVIDGGANVGQFAHPEAETYPGASTCGVEPLPAAVVQFGRNLADRPGVKLIESALGSRDDTFVLHPK